MRLALWAAILFASALMPPLAAETITIASVPSVPSASTFLALDKGYFKEAGLDVRIETIDSLSKAVPFLAQNKIQVAQGGMSAGYFNAVAEGLPIIMVLDSGSTPLYHQIVLRPDLKDVVKSPRDLIARSVALSGPGSSSVFELGQVLASVGLRLASVDVKYLGFQQAGAALANGALDAAFLIAPYTDIAVKQGMAVRWIDPEEYLAAKPMTNISYMANLDWARENAEAAQKLFTALARAGRDYCQAYHHGPNRAEVIDILVAHKVTDDRALLDSMDWPARDPSSRFNLASLQAMQRFYKSESMIERDAPAERLATNDFADAAAKALGPFTLIQPIKQSRGMPMKIYNPPEVHEPSAYSHAIELPPGARVLYISGQVGAAPDGSFPKEFAAQAENAFKNLAAVLAAAGMTVENLIKVNSYLVRREDLDSYRAIRSRFYGTHRPASTLLLISGLAREGGLIEVEAVAAKV